MIVNIFVLCSLLWGHSLYKGKCWGMVMKLSIFPRIWVKAARAREDEEIERRRGGEGRQRI